jgi:hypothetical protein
MLTRDSVRHARTIQIESILVIPFIPSLLVRLGKSPRDNQPTPGIFRPIIPNIPTGISLPFGRDFFVENHGARVKSNCSLLYRNTPRQVEDVLIVWCVCDSLSNWFACFAILHIQLLHVLSVAYTHSWQ